MVENVNTFLILLWYKDRTSECIADRFEYHTYSMCVNSVE